jgi:hypothetical protein
MTTSKNAEKLVISQSGCHVEKPRFGPELRAPRGNHACNGVVAAGSRHLYSVAAGNPRGFGRRAAS